MSSCAFPAGVAQGFSDLLMKFPAAACGGAEWSVLVRKYETHYRTNLDITRLGDSSPLGSIKDLSWGGGASPGWPTAHIMEIP